MSGQQPCVHEWGIDGQHSNEYCKKCFVPRTEYSEPWTFDETRRLPRAGDGGIVDLYYSGRRIVACVNACAGIPDAELEGLDVKRLQETLLALATRVCEFYGGINEVTDAPLHEMAKRAVALAKGGAR